MAVADAAPPASDHTLAEYERVTFESQGEELVGHLYRAAFGDGPAPAAAILGPETFQKEQAPTQYARRLAQVGFTALAFDPRYRGESGGEPRCYEDPLAKVEDARAALRYLASLSDVDGDRLAMLGICMGAGHTLRVAADEPLVKATAVVTGHYRDPAADAQWLGGADVVASRLARGRAALETYESTGEVDYVAAVDAESSLVGMPGQIPWSWYQLWADQGRWENRYAVMSDAAVLPFDSLSAAARLTTPLLMVHANLCALPNAARRNFAVVPTADKRLVWQGQTRHLQYYDDPDVIDGALYEIVDWFASHLGPGARSDLGD